MVESSPSRVMTARLGVDFLAGGAYRQRGRKTSTVGVLFGCSDGVEEHTIAPSYRRLMADGTNRASSPSAGLLCGCTGETVSRRSSWLYCLPELLGDKG